MTEQEQEQPTLWKFAESYRKKFGGLPPSQQREVFKRLTTRLRNPLTLEPCAEPSDEITAVLTAVNVAYLSKKQRSKQASATKREASRVRSNNIGEPAEVEALADSIAAISLEPAEITVEEPSPEPAPTPARVPAPR